MKMCAFDIIKKICIGALGFGALLAVVLGSLNILDIIHGKHYPVPWWLTCATIFTVGVWFIVLWSIGEIFIADWSDG